MTNEEKATEISKEYENWWAVEAPDVSGASFESAMAMAGWKDEQFWSKENIERIIITYKSFPDRSCPGELVKKTIEKLKPQE